MLCRHTLLQVLADLWLQQNAKVWEKQNQMCLFLIIYLFHLIRFSLFSK